MPGEHQQEGQDQVGLPPPVALRLHQALDTQQHQPLPMVPQSDKLVEPKHEHQA